MANWKIDGVPASSIRRGALGGNTYTVTFDRRETGVTLEQIEKINWAKPTVEYLGRGEPPEALPYGYGFQVSLITYNSRPDAYTVELIVAKQYLGDVTGYQAQIVALETAATETKAALATANAQLAELEAAYDDN